jgi:lipopolysaccharide transport system ATP-binding protein
LRFTDAVSLFGFSEDRHLSDVFIRLESVDLDYTVYSSRAQSIRHAALDIAVGGKLFRGSGDMVVVRALDKLSLHLTEGDRLGIMGHNGSGKTTLLKVMAGIFDPVRGRVDVRGKVSSMIDIGHGADHEANAVDNIKMLAALRQVPPKQIPALIEDTLEFADLGAYAYLPIKTYSAGMVMRLLFAVSTALEPDILLLDEWIGAGDAGFVDKASTRMNDVVHSAKIVVLASHSEGLIRSVSNKLLVLDHGKAVYMGDCDAYFRKRDAIALAS